MVKFDYTFCLKLKFEKNTELQSRIASEFWTNKKRLVYIYALGIFKSVSMYICSFIFINDNSLILQVSLTV